MQQGTSPQKVTRVERVVRKILGTDILLNLSSIIRVHGLSVAHFNLMNWLKHQEEEGVEVKMTDVARTLGHSTAAATGTVDRLEKLGQIERRHDPSDRRKTLVRLTEKGKKTLADIESERNSALSAEFRKVEKVRPALAA